MAKKISLSFSESAVSDLENLLAYYAEQATPETGKRLVGGIIAQVERLSLYPDSGRVVPEFGIEHLREIIHPPFRIVSSREKGRVRVVRVWRSERLLKLPRRLCFENARNFLAQSRKARKEKQFP